MCTAVGIVAVLSGAAAWGGATEHRFKILHVMSYHSPWEWTDDQFSGFKDALKGVDVEYRVFQMDTKRRSDEAWKAQAGRRARALIDTWKPDLVYTNDDNAQAHVARYYVNKDTPFVFSAVNAEPGAYGFAGSRNVTGVLEQEHAVETIRFVTELVPSIRKVAIIVDDDPTWLGVMDRMKRRLPADLPDIQVVHWDIVHSFAEYRDKVLAYQTQVDALGLLGIHTFKDEMGKNVPWQDVLQWTALNSVLPDFSFWKDRVQYGTLAAVYVSGYQQGLAAGRIAHGILVDGKSPEAFPILPTIKGQPVLSLARARRLGIRVKTAILLSAVIVERFEWEK